MSTYWTSLTFKNAPRRKKHRRGSKGVTLVELIVCISMLAILTGLAIPSFSNLQSDWRRDSAVRDFMGDLQLGRSTALRTSRTVVMCATPDGVACANGAASSDWRQGWIVFSDLDGNGALGNAEPVVVLRGPPMGLQQMHSNIPAGQIEFRPNGLLRRGNATVNVLAEGAGAQREVNIRINTTGRVFLL
jgi:type IV fimbrial biogenesis protein FimT